VPARTNPALRRALVESVLTGLSGQAALIVSGVVAARTLGVEDRGNLALLIVLPAILAQLGGLGLPLAVTFEIAREPSVARPLLRQISLFVVPQTVILTLVHAAILAWLVRHRGSEVQFAAVLTLVAVPASIALQHGLAVMQGQQRYREFNLLRLAPVVLYAGLALVVFIADSGDLPVLAGCFSACYLSVGVAALALAVHGSSPRSAIGNLPATAKLLQFGMRSVVGSAAPSDGSGVDQAVVGVALSTGSLGLYVVAAAFMNLSRFVTQSVGLVAYPNVAGRLDRREAEHAMWKFTAIAAAAAVVIIVGLEFTVGWLIVLFFGPSFAAAAGVARVLLIAAFFLGVRRVLSDAARGAHRPLAGSVAEITSWAVLIPALFILTPLFDLYGVAAALTLASAASLGVIVQGARRAPKPDIARESPPPPVPPEALLGTRDVV